MEKKNKNLIVALVIIGVAMAFFVLVFGGILVAIAVPSFLRAREVSRRNQCQENLSKIDGAKQQWALENNCDDSAIPTWSDLVGDDKYIRLSPVCPSGGHYVIGAVSENPTCSQSTNPNFPHEIDW